MKPENVLCSDVDRVSPVKLCDLDLASKASPASPPRLTNVNSEPDLASPVGSAEFMAPEVSIFLPYIFGSKEIPYFRHHIFFRDFYEFKFYLRSRLYDT